jgi:SepF-like predicted cell division protein (DUF552 family)
LPNLGKAIRRIGQKMKGNENSETPETPETNSASPSTNDTHKVYLRAFPLRALEDVEAVKNEIKSGNILILRITPLAKKSVEDVKQAVNELCEFVEHVGGDIARLGEERVVVTPSSIRIWREKTSIPTEETATAA